MCLYYNKTFKLKMQAGYFFMTDTENSFHKVQFIFVINFLKKLGIEGIIFNKIKADIGGLVL